jgi:AmmeMemoRadiSam system protein B
VSAVPRRVGATRQPAAAGRFYPEEPGELAALVDRLLAAAPQPAVPAGRLRALLVPHAGYHYSGPVAAAGYAAIRAGAADLRVALLGPSHFVPLEGLAISEADVWVTPLGSVPVDPELCAVALEAGAVDNESPHRIDHALEVQLPFLQRRAGRGLQVVPIAVGPAEGAAELVAALSAEALIVVSSDLSHYHEDADARRIDSRTAQALLALDDAALGDLDACGIHALRALVRHARRHGWTPCLLDQRTSADAGGDRRQVVGYAAFAFTATD